MFKKLLTVTVSAAVGVALFIGLVGCQTTGGPKQTAGTFVGAAGGALVGSQFGKGSGRIIATALGTILGAQLGASIGKGMDDNDRRLAGNTAAYSLESRPDNRVSRWRNPNNNHNGEFVVTRTVEDNAANTVCRDYVHTVVIDGKREKIYGRACRDMRDTRARWNVQ